MNKMYLMILMLALLPATGFAADGSFTDPKERGFPADYREAESGPPTGKEIRKYAEDAQEGAQENFGVQPVHDNEIFATFRADRFEHQWREHGNEVVLWDVAGWIGNDYNRIWLESEGEWSVDEEKVEEAEVELFYGHSIASFWDLRFGVRHDFEPDPERTFAAVGIQGLAPQWFETEANVYLSEDGDVSAGLEAEYELMLTQRLHLIPRLEAGFSAQDVPEYETWQGITDVTLGSRLMYQIRREFAPYVGVSWSRKVGETAHNIDKEGGDVEMWSFLGGVRFWF